MLESRMFFWGGNLLKHIVSGFYIKNVFWGLVNIDGVVTN
jgi:hypothetical protein